MVPPHFLMSGVPKIERPKAKGPSIILSNGTKLEIKTPPKIEIKTEPAPAPPQESKPAKEAKKASEAKPAPKQESKPKPAPKAGEAPKPEEKKPQMKKDSSTEQVDVTPAGEFEEEEEEFKGEVLDETVKKHMNIVFIGHVDAGKSTLCGHVLFLSGVVDQREVDKYKAEAAKIGMSSWYFSWFMDLAESERAKGKTEELGVAHFETSNHKFTILDAPGHRTYVPQMIGGAVQADVAVLVVSARAGEFEAGFVRGGQTSEHLLISKTAGVRYIIIVVNKMDDPTVNWSKKRYDEIVNDLTPFITKEIGFKQEQFVFIPIAALTGYNIKERSTECPWFTGPTLLEALDATPLPPRNENDAFCLPVYDRYRAKNLYAHGKIEKGVINEGSQIVVMPSSAKGSVASIFADEVKIHRGVPGDNVRLTLQGIDLADIQAGSVICMPSKICHVASKIEVKLRMTANAPDLISSGFSAICHIHTETSQVIFDKLKQIIVPGKEPEKNPRFVKPNQTVECILSFPKPICVECFSDFPQLGRFIIRYEGFTIAVGVVTKLPKEKKATPK